ncbi:hypothetical protein Pcinc_027736 [Petrolisthes cinctipes]|uniref:Uncharacterized protein n=1 Tax=Petrolisthes cinctipes TaxID=88211 RepID=A0AAE1K8C1_PETCI|nr:hypothetical protein Pcinc_027736 [Petrolisthes cinctipes]
MGIGEGYGTGQGEGAGEEGLGSGNGNVGWSIFWLIILILIGFWLASLCAFLYIIFNMFAACIEGLTPVCDVLLKGIQFTGVCARCMIKGTPVNEAFN